MRRAFLVLLAALLLSTAAFGDETNTADRARTSRIAMSVLGGWAVGNIAVSTPLFFTSGGSLRRFHEMNVAWNLVNLGIAGLGLVQSREPATDFWSAVEEQQRLESTLFLNIGLNVAYMATGWALIERSRHDAANAERWLGYGQSLILQGGFLLAFDISFLLFQQRNRPEPTVPR